MTHIILPPTGVNVLGGKFLIVCILENILVGFHDQPLICRFYLTQTLGDQKSRDGCSSVSGIETTSLVETNLLSKCFSFFLNKRSGVPTVLTLLHLRIEVKPPATQEELLLWLIEERKAQKYASIDSTHLFTPVAIETAGVIEPKSLVFF